MGCIHSRQVPAALVPLTAATLRMVKRTASPPVRVNITVCYKMAVVACHCLPSQHFLPNIVFFFSFHPLWDVLKTH